MNRQNFLETADLLESLPNPESFHISSWIAKMEVMNEDLETLYERYETDDIYVSNSGHYVYIAEGIDYKNIDCSVIDECGTAACVAGWIALNEFKKGNFDMKLSSHTIVDVAQRYLGINDFEATQLFYPMPESVWGRYSKYFDYEWDSSDCWLKTETITNVHAAKMLRGIAFGIYKFNTQG